MLAAEIRNPKIHAKARALVERAITLLLSSVGTSEEIPHTIVERRRITGPGAWTRDYQSEPDYFIWVFRHETEIQSLPEYAAFSDAMYADPVFSAHVGHLVGTVRSAISVSLRDYLSYLLTTQFPSALENEQFNPDAFDRHYLAMESFFYGDKVEFREWAPLENFDCDIDSVDLGGSLTIRRIPKEELEGLLDTSRWGQKASVGIVGLKYAIERAYQLDKVLGIPDLEDLKPDPEGETLGKLITALRLFRAGKVGLNIIQVTPVLQVPGILGGTRGGFEYRHYWGPRYLLGGTDVEDFKEFWRAFRQADLEHRATINIAISRFNYAYERLSAEDKLIDYIIAFEALFFKENEKGEFRHKIAVRVARLLGKDYGSRKAMAKEMLEFYDKRSAVVHGERTILPPGFIEKVEGYLRESIKHFLRQPDTRSHDEMISRLDLQ